MFQIDNFFTRVETTDFQAEVVSTGFHDFVVHHLRKDQT